MAAAIITQAARFCGNVPESNPDKNILEQYDVNRWLADVEARISSQNITLESAKIKEASVLVSADYGNARTVLNGSVFAEITTFAAFKAECLLLWQPSVKADTLANLHRLMTTPRDEQGYISFVSSVHNNLRQVQKDVLNSPTMGTLEKDNVKYVNLEHMMRYLGFGVLYQSFTSEERRSLKKIGPDPTERLTVTANKVLEEMTKSNVNLQDTVLVARGTAPNKRGKKKKFPSEQRRETQKAQSSNQDNEREEPHNKGQGNSCEDSQGFFSGGRVWHKGLRGRGKPTGSALGSQEAVCETCGLRGHPAADCRLNQWCTYCSRKGHTVRYCFRKRDDEDSQGKGKGQSHKRSFQVSEADGTPCPTESLESNK